MAGIAQVWGYELGVFDLCPPFPWFFFGERQEKPPKKQGLFIPTEPPKSMEKKGKKQGIPRRGKTQGIPKERKERVSPCSNEAVQIRVALELAGLWHFLDGRHSRIFIFGSDRWAELHHWRPTPKLPLTIAPSY